MAARLDVLVHNPVKVVHTLPLLYRSDAGLHGLSTGDFVPALEQIPFQTISDSPDASVVHQAASRPGSGGQ